MSSHSGPRPAGRLSRGGRLLVSLSVLACAAVALLWFRSRGAMEGVDFRHVVNPAAGVMERWDAFVCRGTVTVQRYTRPIGTDPESVTTVAPVRWRHYREADPRWSPYRYGLQNVGWRRGRAWQSGWAVTWPIWPVLVVVASPAILIVVVRQSTARRRLGRGHCRRCGYDLRATPG